MSICAVDKVDCKEKYRDKKEITEDLIPDFYHMLGTEPSSDEHPDTECDGKWHVILPTNHDSDKTSDKPKYTHSSCESLRHKGRELDNKGIVEIIPDS